MPKAKVGAEGDHHGADVEPDDDVVELDGERRHGAHPTPARGRNHARSAQQRRPVPCERCSADLEAGRARAPRRPVDLAREQARADQTPRRLGVSRAATASQQRRGQVGDHASAPRGGACSRRLTPLELELDAVGGGVLGGGLDRGGLAVEADHRVPSRASRPRSPARPSRCRDRPAGPSASPASASSSSSSRQRLRGRVGAGAERLAGIDRRRPTSAARRRRAVLPGRPHDEPAAADRDRLVEVAPAVGPVVGDLGRADLDQARRRRPPRASGSSGSSPGRPVDRVLDPLAAALLLDPARRQLEQLGEHALGVLGAAADGEPDHPLVERLVQALGELALLAAELRGITTSTSTCCVAAAGRRAATAGRGP